MKKALLQSICLCLTLLIGSASAHLQAAQRPSLAEPGKDELWLLISSAEQKLQVMLGEKPVIYYRNISWGRGGVGIKQRQGDSVTPVGSFRIRWINKDSKFRVFFGFDYPTPSYADRGLKAGSLTATQHRKIVRAWEQDSVPLQGTELGGALGIHGLGAADASIHQSVNWTDGCIALNNAQIDHLSRLVGIGTRVEIIP